MHQNDTTDRIVLEVLWSLDAQVLTHLSSEMQRAFNNPGQLCCNSYVYPAAFGEGICKHWRIDENLAALYVRYSPAHPILYRRNLEHGAPLTVVGFIGNLDTTNFRIDGKPVALTQMGKYSAFMVNSKTPMENIVNPGEMIMALIILMTPGHLENLFPEGSAMTDERNQLFQVSPEQFGLVQQLEQNLHHNSADFFYIKGTINQLLAQSLPFITQAGAPQKSEVKKMTQLVAELLQDFTRPIPRISEAAALVGVSASKFKTLFVKLYHQSYYSYLQHQKMEKAKELLMPGTQSVADVAYSLGYSSGSHFTRLFRKKFHIAPQAYRNGADNKGAKSDPAPTDNQP